MTTTQRIRFVAILAVALALVSGVTPLELTAQTSTPASPAVGTWFGVARACTSSSRFEQPPNTVNQDICRAVCGGVACPMATFPTDEVAMMPELFADGNMVATDHATLVDGHPIGQGRWEPAGQQTIAGKTYTKFEASFMWFQPRQPQEVDRNHPFSRFGGMAHPRFVMFFDPETPDVMIGALQPFLFNITDRWGIVTLQPDTPFVSPDPTAPLPEVCDPTKQTNPYCAGTFMFVIKRVKAK